MSGGSAERESPLDKKCPNCDLWYMDRGVSFQMHKASCEGDVDPPEEPTDNSGTEQGETLEMPSDGTQGDTGDGSGEQCPSCGADAGDVSGLSDGATVKCTECGETLVWRAE